jgi:signal peptidase I
MAHCCKVRYSLRLNIMQQEPTIPHLGPPTPSPSENDGSVVYTSSSNKSSWQGVLSTILLLALAPLIAWGLITFVFQSYEVDGPSMETTLQNQDRLIVLKTDRTWARITNKHYIPERGEVIVFVKSDVREFGTPQERQLIKRVIGIPGDRVVVNEGAITVFNKEHPEGYNPDTGTEYSKSIYTTSGSVDLVVPEGELFVAGDNRSNSLDSRSFGTIRSDDVVGRLIFRLFPINKAKSF